jgi:hypothetical protein
MRSEFKRRDAMVAGLNKIKVSLPKGAFYTPTSRTVAIEETGRRAPTTRIAALPVRIRDFGEGYLQRG